MTAPLYRAQDWLLVRAPRLPAARYGGTEDIEDIDDPDVRLAIAVASPSLIGALARPADAARAARKVLRYRIRMATRPTPYGMFAGVALGRFADRTDLALSDGPVRTRTRPDMAWLMGVVAAQEAVPEVRRRLRLVANPAAFERVGRMWLSERAPVEGSGPQAGVSVRATEPVRRALAAARRPVPYAALHASLVEATGAPADKVEGLLDELWRQTFLLTDLRPPLTTADSLGHVLSRLPDGPAADDLRGVRAGAARFDAAPDIAPRLAGDPPQVDMALPLSGCGVSAEVGAEAARAAELLLRLTPWPAGPPYLAGYRDAFEARYPDGREVPLLELVDPDAGLGPPASYWPHASPVLPARAGRRAQALADIALAALRDRTMVVTLDASALDRLETWAPSVAGAPPSIEVNAFVAAASAAAVDAGDFRLVIGPNVGGSAAGKNLGRFADLLGPAAGAALAGSARADEASAPDRIWAELAYCPRRFRSANVAVRPAVRSYEIVVGVSAGVDDDHVIPLDELVVAVHRGRFSLRWTRTGSEVTVCAGHMLNTQQAPEVCRFLTDVGKDGQPQLGSFDWGPAAGFPFLPRVEAGRTVLSLARWNVASAVRTGELAPADDRFEVSLSTWREQWDVPRHVYLSAGDNRLLLDLDDAAHVDELRRDCRRVAAGGALILEEVFPGFDDLWLHGPGGRYFCELVVPLLRSAPAAPAAPAALARPARVPVMRLRPPGSDWLYAKIYVPRPIVDDVLVDEIAPMADSAVARGLADSWFFIRYSDPDPHVRLRFRGDPDRLVGTLLPELCTWATALVDRGICQRFGFDTYEREVERFGGEAGAAVAEQVFAVDSTTVVDLLRLERERTVDIDRTVLAVVAVDSLLAGVGLDGPARTEWYRETVTWEAEVGAEYRRRKTVLRRVLGPGIAALPGGTELAAVLETARRALAPLGRAFAVAALDQPLDTVYRSLVHLHCNRLLGTSRADERLVLGLALRTRRGLEAHPGA